MARKRLHKLLQTIAKIIISLAALYFVFSNIEYQDVWQSIKGVEFWWLVPAFLLFILSKLISSYRLNIFLKSEDIQLSAITNHKLYLLGMFYNLFLPGGIGGDAYKIFLIKKNFEVKTKYAFRAILFDRLSGVIALGFLAVGLSFVLPIKATYIYLLWALIPLGLFFFYFIISRFFSIYKSIYFKVIIYAIGVQSAQLICALFLCYAFHVDSLLISYLFVFLISSIVAMIPFTIGGFGARELTFLIGSQYLSLHMETAVAISLVFYLITLIVSFFGIYFSFVPISFNNAKARNG